MDSSRDITPEICGALIAAALEAPHAARDYVQALASATPTPEGLKPDVAACLRSAFLAGALVATTNTAIHMRWAGSVDVPTLVRRYRELAHDLQASPHALEASPTVRSLSGRPEPAVEMAANDAPQTLCRCGHQLAAHRLREYVQGGSCEHCGCTLPLRVLR